MLISALADQSPLSTSGTNDRLATCCGGTIARAGSGELGRGSTATLPGASNDDGRQGPDLIGSNAGRRCVGHEVRNQLTANFWSRAGRSFTGRSATNAADVVRSTPYPLVNLTKDADLPQQLVTTFRRDHANAPCTTPVTGHAAGIAGLAWLRLNSIAVMLRPATPLRTSVPARTFPSARHGCEVNMERWPHFLRQCSPAALPLGNGRSPAAQLRCGHGCEAARAGWGDHSWTHSCCRRGGHLHLGRAAHPLSFQISGVRFRTDKLRPTTGTRRIVGRSQCWRPVANTTRCGRASGENAAAIPHLRPSQRLRREGKGESRAWQVLPPFLG